MGFSTPPSRFPSALTPDGQDKLAIEQTSGRERINIHGAINLKSGQTRTIDVQTVDAASTIMLLRPSPETARVSMAHTAPKISQPQGGRTKCLSKEHAHNTQLREPYE